MGRITSAENASDEIQKRFDKWSEILTTRSMETCYALIAANWATHTGATAIMTNPFARWPMIVVFFMIGIHLTGIFVGCELLRRRSVYADADDARWQDEYNRLKNDATWPYTVTIDSLGFILRYARFLLPVAASVLFILSVLRPA